MAAVACAAPSMVRSASAANGSSIYTQTAGVANAGHRAMKNAGYLSGKRTESRQLRASLEEFQPEALSEARGWSSGAPTEVCSVAKLGLVGVLAAALMAGGSPALAGEDSAFHTYFGTAASASSYGGYGGNSSKKDSAEYVFEVPQGWKERNISKVEKGTNGTDSEFYNPRRKEEKVYLTYLSGFRKLAPRDSVLNNLALSDVNLQDIISLAEEVKAADRVDENGQLYYDFEIDSPVAHGLISVTCAKNKLYAHFVKAPASDWAKDEKLLRHIHESFQTV